MKAGMTSLRQNAVNLIMDGSTSIEEIIRAVSSEENVEQ
jgi:type II secretory ATPase GspE/PulE/Tfp pilus assembly ATPase PilB-like protein